MIAIKRLSLILLIGIHTSIMLSAEHKEKKEAKQFIAGIEKLSAPTLIPLASYFILHNVVNAEGYAYCNRVAGMRMYPYQNCPDHLPVIATRANSNNTVITWYDRNG